ncbi:hypothetical protein [Pontibacter litorisediminis]|uniref:hypothetical protein n=1 Tax=Pontibacter litorisediminis TaxID=1846260 RepID=UPI0023ED6F51|nr:hypothetical protein [Pontibacter litorisediminis]
MKTRLKKLAYHKNLGIAVLVLTFGFGLLLGVYLKKGIFKLDDEINIVDLTSLIATFYIAYFVATYFETKKEADKVDKELILRRLEELYSIIQETDLKVATGSIEYSEAASYAKRLSVSIRNVGLLLDLASITNTKISGTTTTLYSHIRNIKNLLTTTPRLNQLNPPLIVSNGTVSLTPGRVQEIEMEQDELKFNLLKYQMLINQYTP